MKELLLVKAHTCCSNILILRKKFLLINSIFMSLFILLRKLIATNKKVKPNNGCFLKPLYVSIKIIIHNCININVLSYFFLQFETIY
jgi:hypothetical protein